jgi:hypothetical protein
MFGTLGNGGRFGKFGKGGRFGKLGRGGRPGRPTGGLRPIPGGGRPGVGIALPLKLGLGMTEFIGG